MKAIRLVLSTLIACAVAAASATAQKPPGPKTPRPPAVIVWLTENSIKDGMALIRAKQVDLAFKYAACVVPLQTKAVMMSGGYDAFPVTIIEGKHRGCRGYVMREMIDYLQIDR